MSSPPSEDFSAELFIKSSDPSTQDCATLKTVTDLPSSYSDTFSLEERLCSKDKWEAPPGEYCPPICDGTKNQECSFIATKEQWLLGLHSKEALYRQWLAGESQNSFSCITSNDDIHTVPDYAGNFSKGLPHKKGKVSKKAFKQLLRICSGELSELANLTLGGKLKLVDLTCVGGIDFIGSPKDSFWLPPSPSIKSADAAAELLELYAMALVRDIPFSQWDTSSEIKFILKGLNKLSAYWGPKKKGKITVKTLFRGETKADLKGHFVSQFLYQGSVWGNQKIELKIYPLVEVDYLTTYEEAISLQDGIPNSEASKQHSFTRYIHTLRDGAAYIHNDFPGQAAVCAAQFLFNIGCPIKAQPKSEKERFFIELGLCDIHDLLSRGVKLSMAACWYHKYNQLKLRPEAFALLVEEWRRNGCNPYHLHSELLDSPLLDAVKDKWGSYCLPQAYSEGSPLHPSYPSGHATWIGATVTILKAFFDCDFEFEAYGPSSCGTELVPLGYKVKVGEELDKLASNVGTFRNAAGIHYRSDMLGIYLGESVAINILKDAVKRYAFPVKFQFTARNGEEIVITNSGKCGYADNYGNDNTTY